MTQDRRGASPRRQTNEWWNYVMSTIPQRTEYLEPKCPHCKRLFKTWPLAKIHVKRCPRGKYARRDRRLQ